MKKTLLYLLLSIFAVTALFGATAIVANNTKLGDRDIENASSNIYEVVYFAPPYRTIYSLSEVETTEYIDENGKKQIRQSLNFDGTGMSITVKNKESGKVKNYNYYCEYFELDGETLKYEDPISFVPNSSTKYGYTEGEHTISIVLSTDDGETVFHDFTYTIVDDAKSGTTKSPVQTPTQVTIQTPNADNNDSDSPLILPDIRGVWEHEINPENCKVEITEQHGNDLELIITVANQKGTQVAISAVNVSLDNVWKQDDLIYGEGDFVYRDTFHNAGSGTIKVSKDSLTLNLTQGYNSNRGWNILRAIGEYTRSNDKQ